MASINRFRHYCWLLGPLLYSYGGFDHKSPSAPTNSLQILDLDSALTEIGMSVTPNPTAGPTPPTNTGALGTASSASGEPPKHLDQPALAAPTSQLPGGGQNSMEYTLNSTPPRGGANRPAGSAANPATIQQPGGAPGGKGASYAFGQGGIEDIKISDQVFISHERDFTHLVKKVHLDTLEDEARKIGGRTPGVAAVGAQKGSVADIVSEGTRITRRILNWNRLSPELAVCKFPPPFSLGNRRSPPPYRLETAHSTRWCWWYGVCW